MVSDTTRADGKALSSRHGDGVTSTLTHMQARFHSVVDTHLLSALPYPTDPSSQPTPRIRPGCHAGAPLADTSPGSQVCEAPLYMVGMVTYSPSALQDPLSHPNSGSQRAGTAKLTLQTPTATPSVPSLPLYRPSPLSLPSSSFLGLDLCCCTCQSTQDPGVLFARACCPNKFPRSLLYASRKAVGPSGRRPSGWT